MNILRKCRSYTSVLQKTAIAENRLKRKDKYLQENIFIVMRSQKKKYKVHSGVWVYPGMAAWRFANVDKKQSEEIKEKYGKGKRGFGSIPVVATLGKTTWETSIFPDKRSGTYLLPLKAKIRIAEGIVDGDEINFSIEL